MKSIATIIIIFAVFLTGSVPINISHPAQKGLVLTIFNLFISRLEQCIETSPPSILPFVAKNRVIEELRETSFNFKELCIRYDQEIQSANINQNTAPVDALNKAIRRTFHKFEIRAREDKEILRKVKAVNPIGFIAYLNLKNVNESSLNFPESIEEFQKIMYQRAPIRHSVYHLNDFGNIVQRLNESISSTSKNNLPFTLTACLFEDLWQTSDKFKDLLIQIDAETNWMKKSFSPAKSLKKAISKIFAEYCERYSIAWKQSNCVEINCLSFTNSAKESKNMLKAIKAVDPIGFDAYLTNNQVPRNDTPLSFLHLVEEFHATMQDRLRLFNSRMGNDMAIDIFEENHSQTLYTMPDDVRVAVTTEYLSLGTAGNDYFIDLVNEQLNNVSMYYIDAYENVSNFAPHRSSEIDDVQILYSNSMHPSHGAHALCILYQASSKNVLVYDSAMYGCLDPNQMEIVNRLYPFRKDIIFVKPITRQGATRTCSCFAVIYATMLLLNTDPVVEPIRLNSIHGDLALYMRLHILNMFANRKLALMK